MSKRRLKMTRKAYDELVEARDWCRLNDFIGFVAWYTDELDFQAHRRALPLDIQAAEAETEEPRTRHSD